MKRGILILNIALAVLLMNCTPSEKASEEESGDATEEMTMEAEEETAPMMAEAMISSASGSTVSGTATFEQTDEGVKFTLELNGATAGSHAVHLHQKGDCSADDATSAEGHWNPEDTEHGNRFSEGAHHAGDIENIEVGEDGTGKMELMIEGWTIGDNSSSDIINKAIIIHAGEDDFVSQPSGAAGPRVGCGVIQLKN